MREDEPIWAKNIKADNSFMSEIRIASEGTGRRIGGILEFKSSKKGQKSVPKYMIYADKISSKNQKLNESGKIEIDKIGNAILILDHFFSKNGPIHYEFIGKTILFHSDHESIQKDKKIKNLKDKLEKDFDCKINIIYESKDNCELIKFAEKISKSKSIPQIGFSTENYSPYDMLSKDENYSIKPEDEISDDGEEEGETEDDDEDEDEDEDDGEEEGETEDDDEDDEELKKDKSDEPSIFMKLFVLILVLGMGASYFVEYV